MIRDRIRALSLVQGHQDIHVAGHRRRRRHRRASGRRADLRPGVLFPRRPELGQPRLFPEPRPAAAGRGGADRFVGQFYDNRPKPPLVLLSHQLVEQELVDEALSLGGAQGDAGGAAARRQEEAGRPHRRRRRARRSAAASPKARRSASCSTGSPRRSASTAPLNRIEVYDNSHIQGTNAVGAMIVAGPDGLMKNAYRKFTIRGERRIRRAMRASRNPSGDRRR